MVFWRLHGLRRLMVRKRARTGQPLTTGRRRMMSRYRLVSIALPFQAARQDAWIFMASATPGQTSMLPRRSALAFALVAGWTATPGMVRHGISCELLHLRWRTNGALATRLSMACLITLRSTQRRSLENTGLSFG